MSDPKSRIQKPSAPLHQGFANFAKWPPDEADLPGAATPGAPGGVPGGVPGGEPLAGPYDYTSQDGNFKRGATKPIVAVIAMLTVVGAVGAGFLAYKGNVEKMDVKQIAKAKSDLGLLPKAEQLPKWREWAARNDAPEMQQEAFAQLAWAKDAAGLDLIIKGLENSDHRIRGTASQALYEYGSQAEKAKTALGTALKDADNSDKPQIAWALAVAKDASVWTTVFDEYRSGHLSNLQRLDGAPAFDTEVLVNLSTMDKLAEMKADPSPSVRQLVATALSRSGDAKWTEALIGLVKDKDVEVAREAAVGLGKIANEQAMGPLLEALTRADKDSRQKFLEALRDGVGSKGLTLALRSVSKETAEREKVQTKVIFDMLRELEDPRGGELLEKYAAGDVKPHWKTEAGIRLAEVGDLRAVPILAWRLTQDPLKLYNQVDDPELRQDDNERVISARMLADLAILYPEKKAEILAAAEAPAMGWITSKPQPHANGLRFLVAAESKAIVPQLRKWADPTIPLPEPGAQPPMPMAWETAQSALRYLGWSKDPQSFSLLEKQLTRQGKKKYDVTMEGLMQGGLGIYGMTLRGLGVGASDGFAQWGDSKIFPTMIKYIEDKEGNEQSRIEACFALPWVATDAQMQDVAKKVREFAGSDPKVAVIRGCYLEALVHRSVPQATATLLELIKPETDLGVRHQAARAIGIGGVSPETAALLLERAKDPSVRTDAVLALLIGSDQDTARRAIALYNGGPPDGMEELKGVYNQSFGYWSDANYEHGDVARWVDNAESLGHVKVNDTLQDWPKQLLVRALAGDFDNGPHSMTRVQLRVRLYRDAKNSDPKKQGDAIRILKFMKEKGVLMALRSESGPWQEAAREAFFQILNPKLVTESLPDAPKK